MDHAVKAGGQAAFISEMNAAGILVRKQWLSSVLNGTRLPGAMFMRLFEYLEGKNLVLGVVEENEDGD